MISRVQIEFTDADIQRIGDTVHSWRGEIPLNPPFVKGAELDGLIRQKLGRLGW